ncbi:MULTISPECIES: hypothetical protein [unclassified Corynebacterium]|uniref:hypothetical protein n=1 Tax=unclassified Corynebacterium TaxID=2624378 RepID=UPI0021AAD2BD|nr:MULTISPECIES: hypothetical protein [unclassified Corynebacterium]MCT1452829.1 hypothetical protein [Corynebacterium sp. p3-SID1145]MCT1461745.1 hypothetical protein [Corynebacterium sp. p3-SID1140]MDN8594822.1 hypothetical protein [Corynebacterium sp. P4_F2]WKK56330.1 hypothetical protein QYR03_03710 [Corynebacterium sp. P4-C1]WKK63763.1 hypothetical protein QYR04_02325 [Corynebacterium sp. P8-C1]
MRTPSRKIAALAALAVASTTLGGLTACTQPKEPVRIAADPADPEQMVLAEIYRQVAELSGREVGIVGKQFADDGEKLALLQTFDANLAVMCVGSLVVSANPGEAKALEAKKTEAEKADSNDTDLALATYDAAVGTLPGSFTTVDPSPAEGCAGTEHAGLPQNIIPVYKDGLFDRGVRNAMSKATRALSTTDLEKLVERAQEDGDPGAAVNEWMQEKTGMGSELERIVDEGQAREA